jgi:hypothetical protein
MKGSTKLVEVYIRKYSSPLEFYLCIFATAIWKKEIGKNTKTDDDADQVTIKTREKLAKEAICQDSRYAQQNRPPNHINHSRYPFNAK